jgi:dCMP deaminase
MFGKLERLVENIPVLSGLYNTVTQRFYALAEKGKEVVASSSESKRGDYISWDEYFMGVALLSAKRSKDPNTQVGACIVDEKNRVVGVGYNGFPCGCSDDDLPWAREAENINDTKYPYVVHAELNAVINSIKNLEGARVYVDLAPCNECTKVIIQSGIREVIYLSDKYKHTDSHKASMRMLDLAGVKYRKFESKLKELVLNFEVKD